jgi:hypothetical protein
VKGWLLQLVLVEFRTDCGVRFTSGRSFRREGCCGKLPGAKGVRGDGSGEAGESDGDVGAVGDPTQELRDRVRRGGERAIGISGGEMVVTGNGGENGWRCKSRYVDGTLVAGGGKGTNGVGTILVAPEYSMTAWSANGDMCSPSRIVDHLVGSFPEVVLCTWVYIAATRGAP